MRERRAALVAALAGALLATGCATVPHSGRVALGRAVPPIGSLDESDIRVLPPAPVDGQGPGEVVRGFLDASANFEDDYAIAREYLTPTAAQRWHPRGVTIYTEGQLTIDTSARGKAVLSGPRTGVLDPAGSFRLAKGTLRVPLPLAQVDGQWRIARGPDSLLLSSIDVNRSYRTVDVYYLDPSLRTLVPDQVVLQVPRRGLPTAMVRRLLAGPTGWLAPAVRTAMPPGTQLIGNVPVDNGVADVNLSAAVLRATPDARRALSAQVVWTLRQLAEVSAVRLRVEGQPLSVPGAGDRQSRDDWPSYDPDVLSGAVPGYYAHAHRLLTVDGKPVEGPVGRGSVPLEHPAVSPRGGLVAGLRTAGPVTRLLVGSLDGDPAVRLTGRAMTPPTWDLDGEVWTVVTGFDGVRRLVRVPRRGAPVVVAAGELLSAGRVLDFRLARDGTRFAALVSTVTGSQVGRVVVGRLASRRGGVVAGGLRPILPSDEYAGARAVCWLDADHVVVLAQGTGSDASRAQQPVEVRVDGSTTVPVSASGLPPLAQEVAAAPGRPLLVAAAAQVWTFTAGTWEEVGPGGFPAYPG